MRIKVCLLILYIVPSGITSNLIKETLSIVSLCPCLYFTIVALANVSRTILP